MVDSQQHSLLQSTRLFPQRVFVQLREGVRETKEGTGGRKWEREKEGKERGN